MATFDDFMKLDIRVGTIIGVVLIKPDKQVKNGDKLG